MTSEGERKKETLSRHEKHNKKGLVYTEEYLTETLLQNTYRWHVFCSNASIFAVFRYNINFILHA